VLVYFRDLVSAQQAVSYFHTNKFRGWKRKVYLVEGTPWLEDMLLLKPSFKLKVTPATFKATLPLSEEALYSEMRQYGTIKAMEMDPKQEFATFTFRTLASAISARLCLHMKEVAVASSSSSSSSSSGGGGGTGAGAGAGSAGAGSSSSSTAGTTAGALVRQHIRVTYDAYSRFAWIGKMFSNPRFTVPVLAVGFTLLSYLLIDPVRVFNVVRTLTERKDSLYAASIPETPQTRQLAEMLSEPPNGAGLLLVGPPEARQLALEKV
jgi:hypothetical protein